MVPASSGTIPPNSPPVSKWFGFFPNFRKDVLGFLVDCRRYGDVVKLPVGLVGEWLLRRPDPALYVLYHPDDVKHVLVGNQHNYVKGPVPPVERRIFGQGLLHLEGAAHHAHRRLLLPFFHGTHIHAYAEAIVTQTARVVERWQEGQQVDVGQAMSRLTLSIIWPVLFGQELGEEAERVAASIEVGHRLINKQYHSIFAQLTPLWIPTRLHRRFGRFHDALEGLIRQRIRERRADPREQQDVLSLLCRARDEQGHPLTENAVRDELVTLMLAGHETTANALTWTWILLSRSPEIRAKLDAELNTVLQGRAPSTADLPHLVYTKMLWDESLRLYPPAWSLHTRVSAAEDPLPSGVRLPAGAYVLISPWSIHRDPRWFPDPERFDPERFAPQTDQVRPAFSYLPFGGGGRRCMGEAFAELEGILVLATLASRTSLQLPDRASTEPDALMTLRPKHPVVMTVTPLTSRVAASSEPSRR
ncbi:MAG: cytochrome P450 [Nitrospiraceae bacterium]|nr:cytochrome P450 [Nitrospiraceae bacterium]